MATKKAAANAAVAEEEMHEEKNWLEDRVTIRLPRAPKGEPNFKFASVNGYSVKIMRGVDVQVPRAIAAVLEDARRAEDYAAGYDEEVSY